MMCRDDVIVQSKLCAQGRCRRVAAVLPVFGCKPVISRRRESILFASDLAQGASQSSVEGAKPFCLRVIWHEAPFDVLPTLIT